MNISTGYKVHKVNIIRIRRLLEFMQGDTYLDAVLIWLGKSELLYLNENWLQDIDMSLWFNVFSNKL